MAHELQKSRRDVTADIFFDRFFFSRYVRFFVRTFFITYIVIETLRSRVIYINRVLQSLIFNEIITPSVCVKREMRARGIVQLFFFIIIVF